MRYFLVIAILTFTGGLQAAQAGSLTAPTAPVSQSIHGKWRNACPIYLHFSAPRVSSSVPSVGRGTTSVGTHGTSGGGGSGKTTSMRKAGGSN
jgi:hypothetical protein